MRPIESEEFEQKHAAWIIETQRQLKAWRDKMPYGTDGTHEEIEGVRQQYDNVTPLPKREEPAQEQLLIGPFEHYNVIVDGRVMPLLTGYREGDKIWLVVDHRFACGPFTTDEDARQAARLAGQAMAVTAGYPHLGADSKHHPFAPRGMAIDSLPSA